MKLSTSGIFLVVITAVLAGCTSNEVRHIVGSAIADQADTQVAYNTHACKTLRMQCVQGNFQEWETSDKQVGCSCKKL